MISESQLRATAKYHRTHYKQVAIRWPVEFVDMLGSASKESGESLAAYVRKAIEERMERDGFKQTETNLNEQG